MSGVINTLFASYASSAFGEAVYTSAGTYSFIAQTPVISVVCVGGGGGGANNTGPGSNGGGGGGLGYKNNYPVTPGTPYTVVVGDGGPIGPAFAINGGDSYFDSPAVVRGGGGSRGLAPSPRAGGTYTGDGGGNGGSGGVGGPSSGGGGGGAGGYSGNGGNGGNTGLAGTNGAGGGGGGGGAGGSADNGGGGGGVGILGEGSSGIGGIAPGQNGEQGTGGSGGTLAPAPLQTSFGGLYGGGGGGSDTANNFPTVQSGSGGVGAVRIIWDIAGNPRAFPNTNTGN